jgi:DNA-binding LacI/PurR family transcriptional regulator
MESRTVTIRDVAAQAGVSGSTVSRVLSGVETQIPISEETRERVLKVARELGYRPHPGARALSGKSTHLLGVIVREISDPFFADLIEVISGAAKERGYDLVLGNAKRDPEQALALREMMLDMRYCDGILLCGDLSESPEDHGFLARMGTDRRLVSVARGSTQLVSGMPSVGIDNRAGTFLVLDHLAGLGHRQIACMNASRVGDLWERLEAYREFMQDRFGGVLEAYVQLAENTFAGGYRAAHQLLSLPGPPTAIFCLDDAMAIGALSAALGMGLDVPRYVSIAGFDDMPVSAYVRPALTTVHQPVQEIGEQALGVLLHMIEDERSPEEIPHIRLEPRLVVRDSCGPPGR